MTRKPLREAEGNNLYGAGALTDAEVAEFKATVDYLRSVIPAAFGLEWNDPVFSGDGYVVTEVPRSSGGRFFDGYQGVRKTANGYVAISASERNSESGSVTFSRFEDAVKGYAAGVIDSFRMELIGRYLGFVAWMWNGSTGPGVVAQPLNRSNTQFRYSLEDDSSIWLEGRTTAATLSHGLGMSIPAFIAVIIAHPKVTGEDATAWPKPVQP
ncbi:hypothetical protein O4214_05475 [Rhodococcus erythropolis]|uniref:hypothetical protein n=1 Tax=Rhodococcus erythropolis TaxID=1833 RepID=UPI001E5CFAB5|nr:MULTISPECIES: hypothetical protein [Rhodococcus erythropolis group]MCD2104369.1 hypothetical protein [Rhodococcus qingshengii]MCZ4523424.1 hypothetical protein [Rhodococcus erythropolis]